MAPRYMGQMNENDEMPEDPRPADGSTADAGVNRADAGKEDPAAASPAAGNAAGGGNSRAGLLALTAAGVVFGLWGLWTVFAPSPSPDTYDGDTPSPKVEALRQEIATLKRSDQISRDANRDLQGTLAERDEEIAGLRADVAFYERFVGATGQRRGLTVHGLQMQPREGNAWQYTATLTQNLNRGAVSSGRMTMALEGTQAGKLTKLSWADLRQQKEAPGIDYSFKYFEEIEGDLVLPQGFKPLRVTVRLSPQGGAIVEQSFPWADTRKQGQGDDAVVGQASTPVESRPGEAKP